MPGPLWVNLPQLGWPVLVGTSKKAPGVGDSYYTAGGPSIQDVSHTAIALGFIFAYPFFSGPGGVADRIAINTIAGGAGAKFRLGIYDSKHDGSFYPNQLLGDSGEQDGTIGGFYNPLLPTPVPLLPFDLYWLAVIVGTASPSFAMMGPAAGGDPAYAIFGFPPAYNGINVGWQVAQAYGALPAAYPAGGIYTQTVGGAGSLILISLRFQ